MKLALLRSDQCRFGENDKPVLVIPIGAVEQHSRHLPLGTDALIVEHIARALEETHPALVLLAPTVWIGASNHHLALPGSASVGTLTITEVVTRQVLSLVASTGIDRILILNGHGGNQPAVRLALEHIHEKQPQVLGFGVDYWALMFDALDVVGIDRPPFMGHADIIETSILLAKHPELVAMERAEDDGYGDGIGLHIATTEGIPERSRHGGVGDPRGATVTRGHEFFDAAVRGAADLVTRIATFTSTNQRHTT
ncbi:MAG: hypothetical protein B5766_07960 [Candidatus Lumbricidophila eiseniae]|uniref:Creatinine amidohydrolase n=1 Tax=Candidatus Lumbricidiphila eiseniae TaxID=1969409 RepID=A0A2A6FR16_9MICO|nr:MAG: hypothetical protein B5766_07960 [Candidatus Lumbricidophila eiseniae]